MSAIIIWKCDVCGTTQKVDAKTYLSSVEDNWAPEDWGFHDDKLMCELHNKEFWDKFWLENPGVVLSA